MMACFRSRHLRILLALSWMVGTGAMSAEAMLPDTHVRHAHQGEVVSGSGSGEAGLPGHSGPDACHCTHAHLSGLVTGATCFPAPVATSAAPVPRIKALHSFPQAPPRQPPRA